jgi:mannose-1-phosphate guanylyltransferase
MPHVWAIVLARSRSFLQRGLVRATAIVPEERTLVVVGRGQEAWARPELAEWPGVTILVEPRSLGTGPSVLLGLAHVLVRDPAAEVIVFTGEHPIEQVGPARVLWRAARRALPVQTAIFEAYAGAIGSSIEAVGREIAYTWLEPASMSGAPVAVGTSP